MLNLKVEPMFNNGIGQPKINFLIASEHGLILQIS